MTGISSPPNASNKRPTRDDTPEERYDKVREVPERYSIIQIGVAVFEENPDYRKYALSLVAHGDCDGNREEGKEHHDALEMNDCDDEYVVDHEEKDNSDFENEETSSNGNYFDDNNDDSSHEVENNGGIQQQREQRESGGGGTGRRREENESRARRTRVIGGRDNEPPEFIVHKYNFYIFPSASQTEKSSNNKNNTQATREVTLNPSSISFLNEQNMDYNKWLRDGIPFAVLDDAEKFRQSFYEKYNMKEREENERRDQLNCAVGVGGGGGGESIKVKKNRLEPTRQEDIAFLARAMASLREWIDSAAPIPNTAARAAVLDNSIIPSTQAENNHNEEEDHGSNNYDVPTSLLHEERDGIAHLTPECNSFLRRCLYEAIEFEYPALVLEKAVRHTSYHNSQICVLRLNEAEKKARNGRLKKEEWRKMHNEQIGMTRVFEALSKACRGELEPPGNLDAEFLACGKQEVVLTETKALTSVVETINKHTTSSNPKATIQKMPSLSAPSQPRLRKRRIPLVIHNGMMDLLFLLTHFHSHTLPQTYAETKLLISHYFPLIYDTKVLAAEYSDATIRADTTALGDLYAKNCLVGGGSGDANVPITRRHPFQQQHHYDRHRQQRHGGDDDDSTITTTTTTTASMPPPRALILNNGNGSESLQMHEASYDAFMTGVVFQCLCRRRLRREEFRICASSAGGERQERRRDAITTSVSSGGNEEKQLGDEAAGVGSLLFLDEYHPHYEKSFLFGRNKLFLMQTLYTIDLERHGWNSDTLSRGLNMSTTFVVSGIGSSVFTRDIVRVLMPVMDFEDDDYVGSDENSNRGGRQVGYEIVWIDETSFMVAAKSPGYGTSRVLASTDANADYVIESTLQRHGVYIKNALERRFPTQTIVTLEEYHKARQNCNKDNYMLVKNNGERGGVDRSTFHVGVKELLSTAYRAFGWVGGEKRCRKKESCNTNDHFHEKKRCRFT